MEFATPKASWIWLVVLVCLSWLTPNRFCAQTQVLAIDSASAARIESLEETVASLEQQVQTLKSNAARGSVLPAGLEPTVGQEQSDYYVTYDDGWVLRPRNALQSPFELKFNLHNQFRYTGFANSVDEFQNAAGESTPVSARNDFDINRGRFVVSGTAFDPNLQFYTNIDYNTVSARPVQLLLSWMAYRFGDGLTVGMGLGKVPGTWEWQQTSRYTMTAERTMATTFFRPSITAGVWAKGQLTDRLHYHAMLGDGFNTFTLQAAQLDTNLVSSYLLWFEPMGDFGVGFSDVEYHESLQLRLGQGFTFAANDADPLGQPGPEQTVVRLSDGTRLVDEGVLASGATVNEFDLSLLTFHFGLKRQGFSIATEYFFRWLTSISGDLPLPVESIFDHGFFVQSGYFISPKRLEAFVAGSQVSGKFGTGYEYGGGINWYPKQQRGSRFTFQVNQIEDSPAQQDRTGYVAGASGTLFRAQWWHFF